MAATSQSSQNQAAPEQSMPSSLNDRQSQYLNQGHSALWRQAVSSRLHRGRVVEGRSI